MSQTPVPITTGSGAASVAAEVVGGISYQEVEIYGAGGASVLAINPDGSINASIKGTPTVLIGGSVTTIATPIANQSVSGTVGASIIGIVPVQLSNSSVIAVLQNSSIIAVPAGNQSVSGALNVSGSILLGSSNASVIGVLQGSVATVIIGGSIAASFTPPANQSVSGTVQVDVRSSVAVAIISGSVAVATGNSSVALLTGTNMVGSIAAYQGTVPWAVAGSVAAFQAGTIITSVAGQVTVVSSLAGGIFPVSGSVAATVVGTPNVNTAGSVVAFQGTSPWVVNFQNSSVIAIQSGSVVSLSVGSTIAVIQANSIAGTYAEDAAHTSGDKGVLTLNVRNDTLSSVTSNDGDYGFISVGPAGEAIMANAPLTKWVSGNNSILSGGGPLTTIIAAQGTSVFTYVTGVQIANLGSASVLISLYGATSSIIGYTIAPAGGGSNIYYQNGLKSNANSAFSASLSGVASIYVAAQGFISKT